MQWVCYIEVQGFYAEAARRAGLAPNDKPLVILREGRVWDGCRLAFTAGLAIGSAARQVLRDVPRAALVEWEQVDTNTSAHAWWDQCLTHTPFIEPGEPHQVFLSLPSPGQAATAALRAEIAQLHAMAASFGFVGFMGTAATKLAARAAAWACKADWLLRRAGEQRRSGAPQTSALVPPGEEARFLAPLPATYLPTPSEVQRKLTRLGIRTIGEAATVTESEWVRQLGPLGRQVPLWCRGVDADPVKPCYPPRQLERRLAFAPEVRERDPLEQAVSRVVAGMARELAAKGEGSQLARLTLEQSGGSPIVVERTLAKLQQAAYPLQQACHLLLVQALDLAAGKQPLHIIDDSQGSEGSLAVSALTFQLGLIGPMPWQQLDLWDDAQRREREERLGRALALLHERFPVRIVGLGPRADLSWREQMLQFNDPYRCFTGGVKAVAKR